MIKEIKIGIIGLGAMGKGLVYQSQITQGVSCMAVCDLEIERCTSTLEWLGLPYQVANNPNELADIIKRGLVAVCESGKWLAECTALDAVIEASSAICDGIEHALAVLKSRKHLILMNSEIDLLYGPLLASVAKCHGVICTSCNGDQYGVLKVLIDEVVSWGFKLVMAGNIKGFLDRDANPTSIIPEADKRNLDYRMCTSYTDGTKLNIEMAIIANAFGLKTKCPGMHGPRAAHVQEVFTHFDFDSLWRDRQPFVDYILGAEPGGGIFVVGYCDNSYQQSMLSYYKMGPGPYYLFYRPYHLCHIEAFGSVIQAVRQETCFLSPAAGFQTNVFAYAKRELKAGDMLDGIGGYCCYGLIENMDQDHSHTGLPIGLADKVILKKDIPQGNRIELDDTCYDHLRPDIMYYNEALRHG